VKKATIAAGNGYVGSVVIRHRLEADYNVLAAAIQDHRLLKGLLSESSIHVLRGRPAETVQLVTSFSPDATLIYPLSEEYTCRFSRRRLT
jgi:hypothetical protein